MRKPEHVPDSPDDLDPAGGPPGGHAARRLAEFLEARFPGGQAPPEPGSTQDEPAAETDDEPHDP